MTKMKRFHKYISKLNRERIGWIIIWITAMLSMPLNGNGSGEDLSGMFTVSSIILIFIAAMDYVDKYLDIDEPDWDCGVFTAIYGGMNGRFEILMHSHSFDTGSYFKILMTGMIPMQIITIVYLAVLRFFDLIAADVVVFPALATVLIPPVVILLRAFRFQYLLMHDRSTGSLVLRGIVISLYGMARLLIFAIVFILMMFIGFSAITQDLVMRGIADNEVASSMVSSGPAFILAIIGDIILCYIINNGLGGGKRRRKLRVAALICALVLILTGTGIYLYQSVYNNVILREDSVSVRRNGNITEYTLDEVQSYRVYAERNESFQIELYFKDGKSQRLILDSSEDTNAWRDKYFSYYNYAAELVQKLNVRGISGKLEDQAVLNKIVSTNLDPRCAEGYRIIEQLTEAGH